MMCRIAGAWRYYISEKLRCWCVCDRWCVESVMTALVRGGITYQRSCVEVLQTVVDADAYRLMLVRCVEVLR